MHALCDNDNDNDNDDDDDDDSNNNFNNNNAPTKVFCYIWRVICDILVRIKVLNFKIKFSEHF